MLEGMWPLRSPAIALWVALAPPALAGPLHERVPLPPLRCAGGVCAREGAEAGALPEAVMSDGGLLRPPPRGEAPGEGEPIFSAAALQAPVPHNNVEPPPGVLPPPLRRTLVTPDRRTATEPRGERPYHETFNPAVFPFKRMTVLDAVDETEALRLRDPGLTPLPLSPAGSRPGVRRDPFYGTVVVDLQAGQAVPLPSPAAGLRLLGYAATPETPLRFFRDGADNLYVRAEVSGRRRLVYLVDAEQRYFAGPLAPPGRAHPRLRDAHLPAGSRLPAAVQRRANEVLRRLGLSPEPDDDYLAVLDRLVAHFRAFELGALASERGSTYLDLALSQRGVCRHRAYAFVITALGAGIPARYVENELHVYAEVLVPAPGGDYWRRIHLGGAPLEQRVVDGEDKVAYQEKGEDPFPQPLAFRSPGPARVNGTAPRAARGEGQDRGAGGRGGGAGGKAEGGPSIRGRSSPGGGGARAAGLDPAAPPLAPRPGAEGARAGDASPGATPAVAESGAARPAVDETAGALATLSIAPAVRKHNLYRGELLRVQGRAPRSAAPDPAGILVDIFLLTDARAIPLGETRCSPDGRFATEVEIPLEAPLGAHRVVARVRDSKRPEGGPLVQPSPR